MIDTQTAAYHSTACTRRQDAACELAQLRLLRCACPCHHGPVAYVSGPRDGAHDRGHLRNAAAALAALGFVVLNPGLVIHDKKAAAVDVRRAELLDMLAIADVLVSLEGWDDDDNATIERSVATACGLTVADLDDEELLRFTVEQWREVRS